jgi:hypothetical protein
MTAKESSNSPRWAAAWPDALAFAAGLAVAWFESWQTRDLVWSLWLSSLVVGYAMIVWTIFRPLLSVGSAAARDQTITLNGKELSLAGLGVLAYLAFGLVLLAFFTFHFGMFHLVHSVFLGIFFPVQPGTQPGVLGVDYYLGIWREYWMFLPVAFVAERQAFQLNEKPEAPPDTAVTAEAIARRKAAGNPMNGMMAPYKNVIRLHLLIFFFAFAHFLKLDSFFVYAVVYAVYFFPWRLIKKNPAEG